MRRALYREYRPRTLSEVVGQPHITSALQSSLKSGKTSHAYLFIGPRGTGKTSVARILAHEINGFAYELEDEHLDIIEIDAASNTGVDNIRSLRENAMIAPSKGKYKVYIIDEVHMLSKSAFNALLKTLEEPPAHVVFIMATTDAHKVPVTITSRSQTYTFKLASPATVTAHLATISKAENIDIEESALKLITKRGGGSFRDSISLLDQVATALPGTITCASLEEALGLPSDQLISELLRTFSAGDSTCARSTLQNLLQQGIKPELIAEDLISQIVLDPQPQLLPLLNQLLEVSSSSRPEVKLLLALLNNPKIHGRESEAISSDSVMTSPPKMTRPEKTSTDPSSTTPAQFSENSSLVANSWSALLDKIKTTDAPFYSILSRATGEFTDNTLTIYVKTKIFRTKIEQKIKNLADHLPENTEIKISDKPPVTDQLIANLNSIFGDVEEIELES